MFGLTDSEKIVIFYQPQIFSSVNEEKALELFSEAFELQILQLSVEL